MDGESTIRVLEQNEDSIAAILENLQLGRLDDCMKHYSILQSNLVSLVAEIDNYPSEESDVYEKLDTFGDVVRRSDLLQGFLSFEELQLPQAPLMMTCDACHDKGLAAEECRIFRKHIDFSHQFSHQERIELIHGAHIMLTRQRQRANISSQRSKRNYKRWSQHEIFTLYLAIALYGMSFPKIEKVFVDDDGQSTRNSSQIRHYVSKNLSKFPTDFSLEKLLTVVPQGYEPPAPLAHLFDRNFSHSATRQQPNVTSQQLEANVNANIIDGILPTLRDGPNNDVEINVLPVSSSNGSEKTPPSQPVLVARQSKNDFPALFSRALGFFYAQPCTVIPSIQSLDVSSSNINATSSSSSLHVPPAAAAPVITSLFSSMPGALTNTLDTTASALPSAPLAISITGPKSKNKLIGHTKKITNTEKSRALTISSVVPMSASFNMPPDSLFPSALLPSSVSMPGPFASSSVIPSSVSPITRSLLSSSSSVAALSSLKDNQQKAQYLLQQYANRDRHLQHHHQLQTHALQPHSSMYISPSILSVTAMQPAVNLHPVHNDPSHIPTTQLDNTTKTQSHSLISESTTAGSKYLSARGFGDGSDNNFNQFTAPHQSQQSINDNNPNYITTKKTKSSKQQLQKRQKNVDGVVDNDEGIDREGERIISLANPILLQNVDNDGLDQSNWLVVTAIAKDDGKRNMIEDQIEDQTVREERGERKKDKRDSRSNERQPKQKNQMATETRTRKVKRDTAKIVTSMTNSSNDVTDRSADLQFSESHQFHYHLQQQQEGGRFPTENSSIVANGDGDDGDASQCGILLPNLTNDYSFM